MSTNKLMEAAADILSGSMKKAPCMPPKKIEGEEQDLGGPTYKDGKPTDDSEKIDTAKGSKDTHKTNVSSITAKPSGAGTGDLVKTHLTREETTEDINAMFEEGTISEDFKLKAATIFEARVLDRVSMIEEEIETRYAGMLEEAVQHIEEELSTKVDDYISYVVEQWITQNELAIETGLRNELAEEFISGLKNLFVEHYIDVPEEKMDLVDELAGKVVSLESKLDEEIERGIQLKKDLVESVKVGVTREICEGLVATQAEKIKVLAESIEFSTEDEYKVKLTTIRENYFPTTGVIKAEVSQLNEVFEDDTKTVITDPFVAAVSKAITQTKK